MSKNFIIFRDEIYRKVDVIHICKKDYTTSYEKPYTIKIYLRGRKYAFEYSYTNYRDRDEKYDSFIKQLLEGEDNE